VEKAQIKAIADYIQDLEEGLVGKRKRVRFTPR